MTSAGHALLLSSWNERPVDVDGRPSARGNAALGRQEDHWKLDVVLESGLSGNS